MNYTPGSPVPARAYLIRDNAQQAYPLASVPLTIGRDSISHILVSDPSASRFHAEVRPTETRPHSGEPRRYTLHSMGATGSSVNGVPITDDRELTEGDEIRIGDTVLRFAWEPLPPGLTIVRPEEGPADHATLKQTMVIRSVEPETVAAPPRRPVRVPRALLTASVILSAGVAAIAVLHYARR